MIEADILR